MKEIFAEVIVPLILSAIGTVFTYFLPLILSKVVKNAKAIQVTRDFGVFMEGFGQRARTKYLEELKEKKAAESDGGAEITSKEASELRQMLYDLFMAEAPLAIKEYAIALGPEVIKGFIGKYITKDK